MDQKQARALGEYLRSARQAKGLSSRALARATGIDDATIVRIEQGAFGAPRPDKLRAIAEALDLPLSDVFALADYVVPAELPSFTPYLRAKYRELPESAVVEMEHYFAKLAARHGYLPEGPAPGEDET